MICIKLHGRFCSCMAPIWRLADNVRLINRNAWAHFADSNLPPLRGLLLFKPDGVVCSGWIKSLAHKRNIWFLSNVVLRGVVRPPMLQRKFESHAVVQGALRVLHDLPVFFNLQCCDTLRARPQRGCALQSGARVPCHRSRRGAADGVGRGCGKDAPVLSRAAETGPSDLDHRPATRWRGVLVNRRPDR